MLVGVYTRDDGSTTEEQVLCIDLPEFMEPEDKALISAAPDLHAIVAEFVRMHDTEDWPIENNIDLLLRAREALTKAQGR